MKVFVTGASGFVGGHLVNELLRRGHEVTALVRPTSDTGQLTRPGVRLVTGDVTDPDSLRAGLVGQEVVFHLAAVVGRNPGGWDHHLQVGVQGTQHVADAASAGGVERLIALSSAAVYAPHPDGAAVTEDMPLDHAPEPWNHYVRQKVLSEELLWEAHRAGKLQVTTFRPPTALGPGDLNLVPLMRAIMSSP